MNKYVNVEVLQASNCKVLSINDRRVSMNKGYGIMEPIASFQIDRDEILESLYVKKESCAVSCSSEMPETAGIYLAWRPNFCGKGVGVWTICYFDGDKWYDSYVKDKTLMLHDNDVTWWRTLPDNPE